MSETAEKFWIAGMTCDSCVKTLTRTVSSLKGVNTVSIDLKSSEANVTYNPEQTTSDSIFSSISSKGYHPSRTAPFPQPSFNIRHLSHIFTDKTRFQIERRVILMGVLTLAFLSFVEIASYYTFFFTVPTFASHNYGIYLFYLVLSVSLSGCALWHLRAYEKNVTCETGMMVGMTIGMLTGFLMGAIVGATNGMFIGSAYGLFVGMAIGAYSGRCCGIMGVMEGLMAGFMGGLMGAMTTFMLLNENVLLFFPIIFGASAIIFMGLTYLIYKNYLQIMGQNPAQLKSYDFSFYLTFVFLLTIITSWIIVYGPRSSFLQ